MATPVPARSVIRWEEGEVTKTADQALATLNPGRPAPAVDAAKEWLLAQLKDGPRPSAEVTAEAKKEGITTQTYATARKELGITWKRIGGRDGQVTMFLPGQVPKEED
jgi:hypothetical protein